MNAMMPRVEVSVDTSSIQKAVMLASKKTTRSMELLLADTAFYTAVKAQARMPYAELSDIDSSLDATATLRSGRQTSLTVGQAIVLARANPNSKYNQVTGGRWALTMPKFAGELQRKVSYLGGYKTSRADFINWLQAAEQRQKSARHSSTHFLQSGWKVVFKMIRALGLRPFRNPGGEVNNPLNTLSSDKLGDIQRGGMGTSSQWFRIENLIGTAGGPLAEEHNAAMQDYGVPALQWAVDQQAAEMREHNLEKKIGDDLRREWESVPDAPAYQRGFHDSKVRWAEQEAVAEMETSL